VQSIKFDTCVTRVTEGKKAGLIVVRELEVGDEFTHDGKLYCLATEQVRFDSCGTGDRVRYSGCWHVVLHHGRENVLLPLKVCDDPFSEQVGSNSDYFPFPSDRVQLLTFKEIVREPVAV